jgi:hypothetical protein
MYGRYLRSIGKGVIHQMWPRQDQVNLLKNLGKEISLESIVLTGAMAPLGCMATNTLGKNGRAMPEEIVAG